MLTKEQIVNLAKKTGAITSSELAKRAGVSRQYASRLLAELVKDGLLFKLGSTRSAKYVVLNSVGKISAPAQDRYKRTLINKSVEEHLVLDDIKKNFAPFRFLSENVASIFDYAFLEMLNNAIEHSSSKTIGVEVALSGNELSFTVKDGGIGVFRNIMTMRALNSEADAIGELLKGKTTTAPTLHSGEGIFFTSKAGDKFILSSFGWQMLVDNSIPDIFIKNEEKNTKGTTVTFGVNINATHHLAEIFKKYSDSPQSEGASFDKTEIHVRLFALGGVYISRSQARRILSGLDKFKVVIMDYDRVPMVGQAFADEVYRVFLNAHPDIRIENTNMNEAVAFMVNRSINTPR